MCVSFSVGVRKCVSLSCRDFNEGLGKVNVAVPPLCDEILRALPERFCSRAEAAMQVWAHLFPGSGSLVHIVTKSILGWTGAVTGHCSLQAGCAPTLLFHSENAEFPPCCRDSKRHWAVALSRD